MKMKTKVAVTCFENDANKPTDDGDDDQTALDYDSPDYSWY